MVVRSAGLAKRSKDQSLLFGQVAHRARQLDLHHSTEEEDEVSVPIQAFTYSLSVTHLDVNCNILSLLPLQGVLNNLEVLVVLGV